MTERFWSADPANLREHADFYKRLRAVSRELRDLADEAVPTSGRTPGAARTPGPDR